MFSVPTKTQYGIRALVHLARTSEASEVSAEIARAEGIPPKYLEGILTQLKAAGLVLSERGKKGGYRLARPASEIRMSEIVEALEGEVKPVGCVDDSGTCSHGDCCLPRIFWVGLKDAIDGYLGSKTLRDVIEA
jgi:Rrf2 family transcriptional regulator, iron-sulfur cluster assembly transcription factor